MPRISLPLRGSSDTFDGMYIPPSAEAAINIVEYVTVTQNQVQNDDGQVLNHLLVGDFNQYTWNDKSDDLFQEWLGESGTWELSESSVPTRKKGSALDKCPPLPGTNVPDEWPPSRAFDRWGQGVDQEPAGDGVAAPAFYPAHA